MSRRIGSFGQRSWKGSIRLNDRVLSVRGIEVYVEIQGDVHLPTIVMLHGFTGSTRTWQEITRRLQGRFRTIAIDLIGHGKTAKPSELSRYSMDEQIKDLDDVVIQLGLERFTLLGYSMGGRTALAYAVGSPEKVEMLILESTSPGLQGKEERESRKIWIISLPIKSSRRDSLLLWIGGKISLYLIRRKPWMKRPVLPSGKNV